MIYDLCNWNILKINIDNQKKKKEHVYKAAFEGKYVKHGLISK